MASQENYSQILANFSGTDRDAVAALLPFVYDELRTLAEGYMRGERLDHTLQPTALVHEAYLRLSQDENVKWQDRAHFYRLAARTMRRILVNYAERHRSKKRGGGLPMALLDESNLAQEEPDLDLLALDEALVKLSATDEQLAQVVELRFFCGCTIAETAELLGVSASTVERGWRLAKAWLRDEISKE